MRRISRALLSVSDKTGIVPLGEKLRDLGVEIISTGGTAATLSGAGIPVTRVSHVTEFPEILDGRVKTLHPNIHAGLLADMENSSHQETLERLGIEPIGMVVVNLYPFAQAIAAAPEDFANAIENIDIGGPCMIRAAAKNHKHVVIVVDPEDYSRVIRELTRNEGVVSDDFRRELAAKAFRITADYDAMITRYLVSRDKRESPVALPGDMHIHLRKEKSLRYGENPHQAASIYVNTQTGGSGIFAAEQLSGKALSFNNLLDLNAAWTAVNSFSTPAAVIIKHQNPCGAATAGDLTTAYLRALDCDPLSAYGSVVALNRPVTIETARALHRTKFLEVIAAEDFSDEAVKLMRRKKNRRILKIQPKPEDAYEVRILSGGALIQERDRFVEDPAAFEIVTQRAPSEAQKRDLLFAWKVCRFVKSNAIVFAKNEATVGIGGGQVSRVDAVIIAARKSGAEARGAVMASDAFFPFPDGIEVAAKAGITAVIQPGGSKRDPEVIAACDALGIVMMFTGIRHFRH